MRARTPILEARERYVTSDLANLAPFVRNQLDVRTTLRCVAWASFPCVAMALYNTGLQANLALAGGGAAAGWRARLLAALGLGHSPTSALDCVAFGALYFLPLLAVVWLAGAICERGFARARSRPVDHSALPAIALLFSLSLPATLPLWQAAVGASLGILIGKEVFGGYGRSFVNPVVVGLALLTFAYPGVMGGDEVWVPVADHAAPGPLSLAARGGLDGIGAAGIRWSDAALGCVPGAFGETSALACLLGLLVLLLAGVASWRIVAGGLVGLVAAVLALQAAGAASPMAALPWQWHVVTGSYAFGLVYLATDPATAAATNPGRWLQGLLIGAFVAVVRIANPAYEDGVLLALFLGNVTAPLLDRIVAFAQLRVGRTALGERRG